MTAWRKTPPTEPGRYWLRHDADDRLPDLITVTRRHGGLYAWLAGEPFNLEDVPGEWQAC